MSDLHHAVAAVVFYIWFGFKTYSGSRDICTEREAK